MNDLLGSALQQERKRKGTSSPPTNIHTERKLKNVKTKKQTSTSHCCFCNSSQQVVSVQKSFTSKSYCLLHYYTSKACRIDVGKIHVIEDREGTGGELITQLPFVQNMFSEAFIELQNEIKDESTKSFEAMSKRESDPLSILLEPAKTPKKCAKNKKKYVNDKDSYEQEGGFLRQMQEKELSLIEQQSRRIKNDAMASLGSKSHSNIFKRRKTSAKSSWHLVMSKKNDLVTESNSIDDSRYLNQDFAGGRKCPSCASQKVEVDANFTSRMNDVSKAQTWGTKRDNDASTRLRCLECNNFWFEDD